MFTCYFIQIFLGRKTPNQQYHHHHMVCSGTTIILHTIFLTGFLPIASLRLAKTLNFTSYGHSHLEIVGLFGSIWDGKIILDLNVFLRE